MLRKTGLVIAALISGVTATAFATALHRDHDPDVLWKIVHQKCAISQKPCVVYNSERDVALLHSIEGRGQYLLIPTRRIAGMESRELLDPSGPNYFRAAWEERSRVSHDYGRALPDFMLSLAINSSHGRTQDQLHIHLDCLDAAVRKTLDRYRNFVTGQWSTLPVLLGGHRYRARLMDSLDTSPFLILARTLAHPESEMGDHTLIMTPLGTHFLLLDDVAYGSDRASGEEVQDHACHIAFEAPIDARSEPASGRYASK